MGILERTLLCVRPLAVLAAAFLVFPCLALTSPAAEADTAKPAYSASIQWTDYGFPHVRANDYAGLGYGMGYAQIQLRECEFFDRIVVTQGRLSLLNGRGAADENLNSDLYYAWLRTKVQAWLAEPADSINAPSREARELVRGWVAGINRYVQEIKGPDGISNPACRGKPYIGPITDLDGWMHIATFNTTRGLSNSAGIAAAIPPGSSAPNPCAVGKAAMLDQATVLAAADSDTTASSGDGSNAYGIGKLGMKGGRGGLLANPHWTWKGGPRYFEIHASIPGVLDAIGITKDTLPALWVGHNQTVAYTGTVSTATRFGYWGLQLNPSDPTQYLYEGKYEPMTIACVTATVKEADGSTSRVARPIYETRWGPVVRTASFPWTNNKAYAFRSAIGDTEGVRVIDELLAFQRAKRVDDIVTALDRYSATGRNTIATGTEGKAFYGDVGGAPKISDAQLSGTTGAGCLDAQNGSEYLSRHIPVLDGSRAQCAWGNDPGTPSGLAGLASSPHLFRDDYVSQSNQSYWLENAKIQLEGFSSLWGPAHSDPGLRPQLGIKMAEERLAGTDGLPGRGFDLATMKAIVYSNRVLSAELARDSVVKQCQGANYSWGGVDLRLACETLARWDLRYNISSRGAGLWRQFMTYAPLSYDVPFDPSKPISTPNTPSSSSTKVLDALKAAVTDLQAANIPLDARLGDVSSLTRQGERIAIHGGSSGDGAYNVISFRPLAPNAGWTVNDDAGGSSYIMAVEFTAHGPESESVFVPSQSDDKNSKFYKDQTEVYSKYGWIKQYFTKADVDRHTVTRQNISGN